MVKGRSKLVVNRDVSLAAMDTIYIEGRIARRDGYYYRGPYRTPQWMHGHICPT